MSRTSFTVASALLAAVTLAGPAVAEQPRTLKMQSSFPSSSTAHDGFKMWADRVDKLTGGQLKVDTAPAGQIVGAFDVLDAAHKKIIDGAVSIDYYWIGK
jgi:TRAP-type mannitol/chloroaromatic compound transport system substrate-binding protein